MAKRKQRIRSPHPGVKLKLRERTKGDVWLARWVDPDTGKERDVSLTALGLTTEESRRIWAIEKSESLRARRAALASGARLRTETPLPSAVALYIGHRTPEIARATHKAYSDAARDFTAWTGARGLLLTESITAAHLLDYRAWFLNRPKRAQARGKGIGRGARKEVKAKRAPVTVNKALRSLKTILNYWRARGITPNLTGDSINDSLKPIKGLKLLPVFLKANECRTLLEAALRHDAERFSLTRQEHDGKRETGTTPRYVPVAPFIAVALLSGMRFAELAGLMWSEIDLETGEISLDAERTKTGQGRVVGLAETPALAALLAQMKLKAPDAKYVWGREPYRRDLAESARKRLVKSYGAPEFNWHDLRRTCGTFLTCAPSIYGAASAFLSAKRLGHSVVVSEKHYAGALNNISHNARTLEHAMGVADVLEKLIGFRGQSSVRERPQMSIA
ncbi:MAG TPA: tyrosine-type recombinase/integrase [Candidatus Hydrogenedentes bacterium]|nr:tyrosine-type recombinase/integrase [Candidatus Hydrogenedentota bacterium]